MPTDPQRAPETDAEARARQLEQLREMAELSMRAARIATARIEAAEPQPGAPDPSLALARAMHAVRQAIALEHRLRSPAPPAAPKAVQAAAQASPGLNPALRDKRRAPLRETLHKAAKAETDLKRRAQLCRFIDERLDVQLLDDPDGDIPIGEMLTDLAEELGLIIDLAKVSDEVLGIPKRVYFPERDPDPFPHIVEPFDPKAPQRPPSVPRPPTDPSTLQPGNKSPEGGLQPTDQTTESIP